MPSRLARYCPLAEFEGRVSPSNGHRHQRSTEMSFTVRGDCRRDAPDISQLGLASPSRTVSWFNRFRPTVNGPNAGPAALSPCIARVHCVGVGRIEPHDQERDVVEGPGIIGLREQLRRGNLGCGFRVQRGRDRLVRHHLR